MAEIAARAAAFAPVAELVAAVAFLTRIPVRVAGPSERTGAPAFGLAGLGLGLVAAAPLVAVGAAHPWPLAILAIAIVAVLDGGFHLDGLADTADALVAPLGAAERARTDPQSGSAGVVAVVLVLGLQAAAIAELAALGAVVAGAAIVVAVTVSRAAAPLWALAAGRFVGTGDGLGRWFADRVGGGAAVVAAATAAAVGVVASAVAGPALLGAAIAGATGSAIVGLVTIRLRGQLDGDGYGALIELTVAGVLLAAAVLA